MRTIQINSALTREITFKIRGVAQAPEEGTDLTSRGVEEVQIEDIVLPLFQRGPEHRPISGGRWIDHSIMTDIDWKNPEVQKLIGNIEKLLADDFATALLEEEI